MAQVDRTGTAAPASTPDYDVLIVGAGIGGLYSLYRLRALGFRVRVLEQGSGVGGTWFWNRYPGARCDVESHQYSYSFSDELQQEWTWTERYASQPEILAYLDHVADRFDLRRDISLDTTVATARYDACDHLWVLTTATGERLSARFCVMATGCLSVPRLSLFPGQESFAGPIHYTATWPREGVDVSGLRVGVIGTSASGTQSIPHFAAAADHLHVFQRTANFSVPSQNRPMDPAIDAAWKADYPALRKSQWDSKAAIVFELPDKSALKVTAPERTREYERRWRIGGLSFMRAFDDLFVDRAANDTAIDFVHGKIAEAVSDPAIAARLMPRDHAIGTRRICTDNGYYDAFNRDNVTLVDVRADPIAAITPDGIRTEGAFYPLDMIVFATGFESMIGALCKIDIVGRDGVVLRDRWRHGPAAYLGVAVAGFPNLFTQTGPLSPATLASLVAGNEQHTDWIADLLVHARDNAIVEIEATAEAETRWLDYSQRVAAETLHSTAPESSYIFRGEDGARRFMVFLGGFDVYREICDIVAQDGYPGFDLLAGADARSLATAYA